MNDIIKFANEEILTGKFINWDTMDTLFTVWLVLLGIFFGIITLILRFHWNNYGVTEKTLNSLKKIYFRVTFVIFLMIITAAGIYFRT